MALGLGPHPLWDMSNRLFDKLPIAAVVGEKIFCVHGGLSPRAHHLAQVVACRRVRDVSTGGILADLTWSDPCSGLEGFAPNHRGCGQLFGEDDTNEFLETSGLSFVCRAHHCVRTGYLWTHNEKVVTVFSAPNYCGQGNDGAIMVVDVHGLPTFTTFRLDKPTRPIPATTLEAETSGAVVLARTRDVADRIKAVVSAEGIASGALQVYYWALVAGGKPQRHRLQTRISTLMYVRRTRQDTDGTPWSGASLDQQASEKPKPPKLLAKFSSA